ncbi:MAG: TolC family protein [Flavitalea sp.]
MKSYLGEWFNKLLLFGACSTITAMASAQSNAFSANEAVEYALKNTVQVKNALLAVQIQQQTNREVTAAAYPQLTGNVGYTNYLNIPTSLLPAEFFGGQPGSYVPIRFGLKHNVNYGVDLNQLLFDGQVFIGLKARKTTIDYAESGVEVTKEQIKANVFKIYYQILAGRQQVETVNSNILRFEKLLSDTKEIYKNGFAEKLDVDKTDVLLTNLRTEKLKAENQLQVAMQGLKLLMGMPAKNELILKDSLPEQQFHEDVVDQVYNYNDRKEYQQILLQEKLNAFNVRRYKLTYIPTVSINGNYTRNAQRTEFDIFKTGQPWFRTTYLGLKIAVPIFDGFARDSRIKKANLELQQTENMRENLQLTIDKEVEESRINLRTAIASMDYQKKNMALAESVYNQTNLKFGQGLGSNLEISTAQTELSTAQNNYYAALYDAIIAKIDYQRATGKL